MNEKKFKGELNFEDFAKLQKQFNASKVLKKSSEKEEEKLAEDFIEKQTKFEVSKKTKEKDQNKEKRSSQERA